MAVIFGTLGDDTLTGTSFNDYIHALAGDDFIDGGAGADVMAGGAGNDTFVVNLSADQVVENTNEGIDTVRSFVTFTLAANVENLVLQEGASIDGFGNRAANTIIGNSSRNVLFGRGGNDVLDGGAGNDTLIGGTGDDTFLVDGNADTVFEAAGEGRDTVLTTLNLILPFGVSVEVVQVVGAAGAQVIGNDTPNQTLIGGLGNDQLIAAGVGTVLAGGAGDDAYILNSDDIVIENAGGGIDSVFFIPNFGGSFTLGANLENLSGNSVDSPAVLTGNELDNTITGFDAKDTLSGLDGDDRLRGGGGDDTLLGGTGLDTMEGASGNDVYAVDSNGESVIEAAGQGFDTVVSSAVSYVLTGGQEIEVLQLVDGLDINGTGNEQDNTIIGGNGINGLQGGAGADTLIGLAGNDVFLYQPGDGADTVLDFTGAGAAAGDAVAFVDSAGFGVTSFAQLLPLISDVAGGCQIAFNATDTLFLSGVAKAQLDAGDFAFF